MQWILQCIKTTVEIRLNVHFVAYTYIHLSRGVISGLEICLFIRILTANLEYPFFMSAKRNCVTYNFAF